MLSTTAAKMASKLLTKSPKSSKKSYASREQDDEVIITLASKHPQAPKNRINFQHTTGKYVEIRLVEKMIDHLNIESTILHKESMEAKKQLKVEDALGNIIVNHL